MQAEAGTAGFVDAQRQEALALREAHHQREAAIYADEALTRDAKREQGARVREEAEADLAELRQVHERQRQAEADRLGALAFGGEGTGPAGVRSAFEGLAALDTAEECSRLLIGRSQVRILPGALSHRVGCRYPHGQLCFLGASPVLPRLDDVEYDEEYPDAPPCDKQHSASESPAQRPVAYCRSVRRVHSQNPIANTARAIRITRFGHTNENRTTAMRSAALIKPCRAVRSMP